MEGGGAGGGGGGRAGAPGRRGVAFDEGNLEANAAAAARGEYGTMKIGEPDTPFAEACDPDEEVAAAEAAAAAAPMALEDPEFPVPGPGSESEPAAVAGGDAEMHTPGGAGEEEGMSEEEMAAIKRELFEAKRKAHYNMGTALRRG